MPRVQSHNAMDIYQQMVKIALLSKTDPVISSKHLALWMDAPLFSVKTNLDILKEKGWVVLSQLKGVKYGKGIPPYWGFKLTPAAKRTHFYLTQKQKIQEDGVDLIKIIRENFKKKKTLIDYGVKDEDYEINEDFADTQNKEEIE